jgi:uncharacterized protein (UPF0303 family)
MSVTDDLAMIARQESLLQFVRFNEETAWHLGLRLREFAVARKATLAIDVRRFGQPLFYCALAGSSPDNAAWAQRKANTVARFHRSSYYMGLELQLKGTNLADRFGLLLNEFAAHGGSFPIAVSGTGVIGAVTVSGLPQREDHQLVVEALCAETGNDFEQLRLDPAGIPLR